MAFYAVRLYRDCTKPEVVGPILNKCWDDVFWFSRRPSLNLKVRYASQLHHNYNSSKC